MSRAGGIKARRNGENFEGLIERACRMYEMSGVAYIAKTPEPMKPIRPLKSGQFIACYTKQAQPDFKGTLRGGRAVCFEAKHTDGDRIEQKRVTPEQLVALAKHQSLGAACFVLVSFRFERFYRVPLALWIDMRGIYGKVSVTPDDLAAYKVDIMRFLDGMEAKAA